MIKIMIVDDMPIFLEYLRGFIHWEEYGFEICAQASNGKEAFDMIEECYPDVILTDITMPYMDGLELAEAVMNQYPDISVILITGNNEFEYARKALKIGVCDYIVKPFEKEELILSLLKLQDNIHKVLENKTTHQNDVVKRKEKVLRRSLLGNHEEELQWRDDVKSAGISFLSDYYLMGCVHLQMKQENDLENFLNWEDVLLRMLNDTLHVNGTYELFKDFQNNIIFIINFENEEAQKKYKAYELTDFPKIISKSLGMECVLCISDYCNSLGELRKSYYQIQETLKQHRGDRVVKLFEKKQKNHEPESEFYLPHLLTELNDALVNKAKEQFTELWNKEWERVFLTGDENAKMQLFYTMLGLLMTDIINSGSSIENIYGDDFRPHKTLYTIENLEQRVQKLFSYYEQWLNSADDKKQSHSKLIAEKAQFYIQEHYAKGTLSVSEISRELYINQTYLRKMFKEETGMTLLEYLTKYRMNMAKRLILTTDYNHSRIAELVGYNDVSYFSKCFKKYYHVSPKQMTKNIQQSAD